MSSEKVAPNANVSQAPERNAVRKAMRHLLEVASRWDNYERKHPGLALPTHRADTDLMAKIVELIEAHRAKRPLAAAQASKTRAVAVTAVHVEILALRDDLIALLRRRKVSPKHEPSKAQRKAAAIEIHDLLAKHGHAATIEGIEAELHDSPAAMADGVLNAMSIIGPRSVQTHLLARARAEIELQYDAADTPLHSYVLDLLAVPAQLRGAAHDAFNGVVPTRKKRRGSPPSVEEEDLDDLPWAPPERDP